LQEKGTGRPKKRPLKVLEELRAGRLNKTLEGGEGEKHKLNQQRAYIGKQEGVSPIRGGLASA